MKNSGGAFAGRVKVGRVLRGDMRLEGRMVVVEGFGNKSVCLSSTKLGDSRLFFLQKTRLGQNSPSRVYKFRLSDNIIKLNFKNLKILWKINKGESINEKKTYFGQTMRTKTRKSHQGDFCRFSCSPEGRPVCARDGETVSTAFVAMLILSTNMCILQYGNTCLLRKEECHVQKTIGISSSGPCKDPVPCPPPSTWRHNTQ